jgi:chemotaxis protein CheC
MVAPNDMQIDALKEVGNIGASHASVALGQMIGETVIINVPKADFLPVDKIQGLFGKEDDSIVILFFMILGEVEGYMVISFSESQAVSISNYLMGTDYDSLELTDDNESALKEVGNILASAYLTAMSDLAGLSLRPSVPYLTYDLVEEAITPIIVDMEKTAEYSLITDNEFLLNGKSIAGKCITFYNDESFNKILSALGMGE